MEAMALIPKAAVPPPTRTLFQHPLKGSWFENIAVRSNGQLLVTRIDAPEVWAIDPDTGAASVLVSFSHEPELRSAMGIAELTPDVWAIGVGYYDHATGGARDGSWEIWKLDLTRSQPVKELITKLPEAGMINGMATWNDTTVIAADSMHGKIFRIHVDSGSYSVALEDTATMAPPAEAPVNIGINGVRVRGGYVYYSSTTLLSLFRIPVHKDLKAHGPAETLCTGIVPDDFCFDEEKDGVLYITGNVSNVVSKVTLSGGRQLPTTPETFAGDPLELDVAGATACAFGRRPSDKRKLYIVTCGGAALPVNGELIEGAKIVAVDVD